MHQKKLFDFFLPFFFGQPAELTAFFVRQIFLHLPELIWIWNVLRRQQATPKILSEWWFFRADVPAPAQAPAGRLCWRCWGSAAMGSAEVPGSREEHIYVHSKWLFSLSTHYYRSRKSSLVCCISGSFCRTWTKKNHLIPSDKKPTPCCASSDCRFFFSWRWKYDVTFTDSCFLGNSGFSPWSWQQVLPWSIFNLI